MDIPEQKQLPECNRLFIDEEDQQFQDEFNRAINDNNITQ